MVTVTALPALDDLLEEFEDVSSGSNLFCRVSLKSSPNGGSIEAIDEVNSFDGEGDSSPGLSGLLKAFTLRLVASSSAKHLRASFGGARSSSSDAGTTLPRIAASDFVRSRPNISFLPFDALLGVEGDAGEMALNKVVGKLVGRAEDAAGEPSEVFEVFGSKSTSVAAFEIEVLRPDVIFTKVLASSVGETTLSVSA